MEAVPTNLTKKVQKLRPETGNKKDRGRTEVGTDVKKKDDVVRSEITKQWTHKKNRKTKHTKNQD